MSIRIHPSNSVIFATMWVALSALVLHDFALRHHAPYGEAVSERVVTKEFVLVDDGGQTRARIGMSDKTNAPTVQLFDASGAQRAQLRLNKDDVPSLRLYGVDGKIKSAVGFTLGDMQPSFITFDASGIGHVENSSRPDLAWRPIFDEDVMGQFVRGYHNSLDTYSGQAQTLPATATPDYFLYRDTFSVRLETMKREQETTLRAQESARFAQENALRAEEQAKRAAADAPSQSANDDVECHQ